MLVLLDIDGTLSDHNHRLHFVTKGKKDWNSFFSAMIDDKPTALCKFLESMNIQSHHCPVVVTGRPEKYRDITEKWLFTYCPFVFYERDEYESNTLGIDLHMRKDGDFRSDYIIKEEMLKNHIIPLYGKPDIVFDDRMEVIEMWRRNGLNVCQVLPLHD